MRPHLDGRRTGGALLVTLLAALLCCSCARQEVRRGGLVVILSDYGDRDHYVGIIKGILYSEAPLVTVDTITNQVPPWDVAQASYVLQKAAAEFPKGTVFLVLVDPEEGARHRPVVFRSKQGRYYVGPDNGVFSGVINAEGVDEARLIESVKAPAADAAVPVFRGKDLFAPVAGRMAAGERMDALGPPIEDLKLLPSAAPARFENGRLSGHVVYVDVYGNLLTSIPLSLYRRTGWQPGTRLAAEINGKPVELRCCRVYGDVPEGQGVAVPNTSGCLELAINMGSLAEKLGARAGVEVSIRRAE